jgi:peptidoglycan/LPS O-acetylase OafA/YrhL
MSSSPTSYLHGLDGLRGVAVGAVLVFHANMLPGGYLGVDLFFVVSGFLITRLLLDEISRSGTVDLRRFWSRRMKRLYPAMLVTLVITAELVWLFGSNAERTQMKGDGLAALVYIANWKTILAGASYWDAFSAPAPLSHLWSLAIEEQFYVVWPLAIMAVLRLAAGSRAIIVIGFIAGAGTVASWLAMVILADPTHIDRVYLGTDARMGSILLGAFVAVLLHHKPTLLQRVPVPVMSIIGLGCLVVLAVLYAKVKYTELWLYRGGLIGQALLVVGLMLSSIVPGTLVHRAANVSQLRWFGRQSYALYLVHMPLFWLYSTLTGELGGWRLLAIAGGASLAIAVVMAHFVESPLRYRTWTRREAQVGLVAALAFVAVAVAGPASADDRRELVAESGPARLDSLAAGSPQAQGDQSTTAGSVEGVAAAPAVVD